VRLTIGLTLNNIVTLKSWTGVTQDHWKWYWSQARYDLASCSHSIITMALSCIISEITRGTAQKSAFGASVRGSTSGYCHTVRCRKSRMVWLCRV